MEENKENYLSNHWFKAGIIAILLLAIFSGNNYLKEKNRLANEQFLQQKEQIIQHREQKYREFDAKQKEACLAVYKQESTKWNNVSGWRYDEENDVCYVQYEQIPKKTKTQCDVENNADDKGIVPPVFFKSWLLCQEEGLFEKSF